MYVIKTDDVYKISRFINAETKEKGRELFFRYCPYCHGGTSGADKDTFSVSLDTGAYKCFRSSCGASGHLVELARDVGYVLETPRTFRQLPQNVEIRDGAIEYLASRGISEAITKAYKITTMKNNKNNIVFPFFDENNILRFVKYRKANFVKGKDKCKEWCEKDCMPILFGMNLCEGTEQVIITEGQIDTLSLAEAGIKNAVSVPTGAKGFTWLPHCLDWLKKFKKIVVFGDMENGKMSLIEELMLKLPDAPIWHVKSTHYLGEKDANDILTKYGPSALRKAVEEAEMPDTPYIKQLADVVDVDIDKIERIPFRIRELDKVLEGLVLGQFYIISGKAGEGKSTFASQILATCLESGKRCFAYSGELPNYQFKRWLDLQLAGTEHIEKQVNQFGNYDFKISDKDKQIISDWYRDRMYIYDNSYVGDELPDLITVIQQAICQYAVDVILIDNLMTAIETDADKQYHQQANFAKTLSDIAKKHGVAVILIAHPKKTKEGHFENDDISGSSETYKRADVVMNYERAKDIDPTVANGMISVTKNRLTGRLTDSNKIMTMFSEVSKRVCGTEKDMGNDIFEKSSTTYVAPF